MLVEENMELAGIFGNRMILQRDTENHIFGEDDKASKVKITIGDTVTEGDVIDGRFDIVIPPHEAAFDIDMTIEGSEKTVLKDICFGDVYMLSGQSNMELPVIRTTDVSAEEIKASNYPYIRQYRLTPERDYKDLKDYKLPKSGWVSAVPGEIDEISAYGFYAFKRLYDKLKIPFGFILNAQGGSTIEAWMREEDIRKISGEANLMDEYFGEGVLSGYLDEQDRRCADWRQQTFIEDPAVYSAKIPEGAVPYELPGVIGGITGAVWLFKEFDVDEDISDAFIYLGVLIDADITYINGHEIGRTEYQYPPRKYDIDPSFIRKGKNLIAVRLIVERASGGAVPYHQFYIRLNGRKTSLEGTWQMKIEKSCDAFKAGRMLVCFPSILYRTSIYTMRNISLKGIMWYQGESDAEHPEGYTDKFKTMIESWFDLFQKRYPLIITELTDYIDPQSEDTSKVPEGWRSIQDQQLKTPSIMADTACVPARDIGDMFEIHTPRKAELGARAAGILEELIY